MENSEINVSQWVDEQLATLDAASEWRPNTRRAWARLKERGVARAVRCRRWLWALSAAAICASLLVLPLPPRVCATPRVCSKNLWEVVFPKSPAKPAAAPADQRALLVPLAAATGKQAANVPLSAPVTRQSLRSGEPASAPERETASSAPVPGAMTAAATVGKNFKKQGSDTAPIICEIYSDYQCPACAKFHAETIPLLVAEYVQTGKMMLVYRDFPLIGLHRYARLAALYADAAGKVGYYDEAVKQIFETQSIWSETGDIDTQVAPALPPLPMQEVRELVKTDSSLDDGITADMAKGAHDGINGTPTLVIVSKGKRQAVPGGIYLGLLKSYLDELLAHQ